MEPITKLSDSAREFRAQKYKESAEMIQRLKEEGLQKKEEAVRQKYETLQAGRDDSFRNFCIALDSSHIRPAQVKNLFNDLEIVPPEEGCDEDEVLKWFYSLSNGEVDVPEPLRW